MYYLTRLILISVAACISCSHSQASRGADLSQGLPLPSIPEQLRDPQSRADYLVKHWWDDMDWTDNKYALDTTWMETTFADYATVLPIATQGDSMQYIINKLFLDASVNPQAYAFLADIATKYLFEPESPVFDEQAYTYFANAQLDDNIISDAQRQRLSWQAQMASLNIPGTKINDFIFKTRSGQHTDFVTAIQGKPSLIIFYNPDCGECHKFISDLAADSAMNQAITAGKCNIVAIADYDSEYAWQATAGQLPDNWIVGLDITDVQGNDLFYLPSTPSVVVTDSDASVICKNLKPSLSLQHFTNIADIQ